MQPQEKSIFPVDMREVWEAYQDDLMAVDEHISNSLDSTVDLINKIARYILNSGGKRLRPLLTLISAHLCGYTGKDHLLLAGVVEFIHTATLLHDDVLDNAGTRRGKSAARTLWGNQATILVGDFLYTQSLCQSVGLANHEINRILAHAVKHTCEGETLQLSHHANIDMTEEEYFRIVEYKTATLLGAACRLGAVIADGPSHYRDAVEAFGLNLGTAFQVIDDTLDYSANKDRLGKSIGNDLREGKVTLPLLHLLTCCSAGEKMEISELFHCDEIENKDFDRILEMMEEYGSIRYATIKAQDYIEKSKKHLDVFGNSIHRQALGVVADYVVSRDY
jgi:octaprenyl-diphosphate synthase